MENSRTTNMQRVLTLLVGVLIVKVTISVVLGYGDYYPPNFEVDFLRGRQAYFSGAYQWAFYTHIIAGPVSLILGLVLISERFRMRFPKWHRSLGKAQAALVLLLLTPSGLWMAYYAQTGTVAAIGFSVLAIVTGMCVLFGWRTAVNRRFAEHRRWMWRCFLLLCSAVVLRLIGGLVTVTEAGTAWSYPLAALGELGRTAYGFRVKLGNRSTDETRPPFRSPSIRVIYVFIARDGDHGASHIGRHFGGKKLNAAIDEGRVHAIGMRRSGRWSSETQYKVFVGIFGRHSWNGMLGVDLDHHHCLSSTISDIGKTSGVCGTKATVRRHDR